MVNEELTRIDVEASGSGLLRADVLEYCRID
jgi:hypothetical protein